MRINSINQVNQIYQNNSTTRMQQMSKNNEKDSVQISETAKDFQTALTAAKASEDVRTDKVEAIKKQMEAGTYQVSNKDVADKLVERFFQKIY
ncbi:MAG: flagellar biosynthesis anti-sigma factor FlgM [bacterium]|nr:flagellar biosynthesis anti-sigma factor FlgM [bacterium]